MAFDEAWVCRAVGEDKSFKLESPRFKSLFGRGEERLCSPVLGSSDGQLLSLVEALGMPQEHLQKKLDFLETYAALEQRDVLHALPLARIGCALQLAKKHTGDVFISQETMFSFESTSGKVYYVSVYEDATSVCTVKHLLDIVGTGKYFALVRALRDGLRSREAVQRIHQFMALLQEELLLLDGPGDVSEECLTRTGLPIYEKSAGRSMSMSSRPGLE